LRFSVKNLVALDIINIKL